MNTLYIVLNYLGVKIAKKDFVRLLELRKDIINPYEIYIRSYLTHKTALLRLIGTYLISHPQLTYSYDGFPFISSAPFIYRHRESTYAYNTIMDQYMLDPLRLNYSDCIAYPLNTSSSIIINSMNIPLCMALSSIDEGLEFKAVDGVEMPIDVYSIGFDNYVVFLDNGYRVFKAILNSSSIEFIDHRNCKYLSLLKYSHYKALICHNNTDTSITISDGVYGIEFLLDKNVLVPPDTLFYLHINIAYIKLYDGGIIAYCNNNLNKCETIELNKHFRPLALLSNDNILGFMKNSLTLYPIDEKKEWHLISIKPENVYSISIDPYKNFAVLSTTNNLYLLDLNEQSLISIPSKKKALGYVSGNYMVLLKGSIIEVFFIESSDNIHIERIISSHSYLVRCSSIGRGIIACIDRAGRIAFIDLKYIDHYVNQHYYLLRNNSGNISIAVPDIAPYTPLKFEGYRELPYNIYRIDSLRSIINITMDNRFTETHTVPLYAQGLLREHRVFISSGRGIKIHSKKPPKVLPPKMYIINMASSSKIVIPLNSLNEAMEGKSILLIKDDEVARGIFRDGTIKFDRDFTISMNDLMYITDKFDDIILGQAIKPLSISTINVNNTVRIISNLESNGIRICIDAISQGDVDIGISGIEAICSDRVIRSSSSCIDVGTCNDILMILVKIALDKLGKDVITIPLQYDRKVYIKSIDGVNIHFNKFLYPKIEIPHKCTHLDNTYLSYDNGLKTYINIINKCSDLPVYLISPNFSYSIEPTKTFKLVLPFGLDEIIRGYINFVTIEPSGIKSVYIDIPLKNIIAYTHRIALKIAALLGIRSNAQKYYYGSSSA